MISFFTDPYENEILYSTAARYHYYSGNLDAKDTLEELFGTRTSIPSISFPSRLEYLSGQLESNDKYSADYFIKYHTLFPLYQIFLPRKRSEEIINDMKHGIGIGLYTKIGMVAGSICSEEALKYCPECVKKDTELLGESYFRRNHQVQGVFVCFEHGCLLKKYCITSKEKGRITFIRMDHKNADLRSEYEKNSVVLEKLLKLAEAAGFILNGSFTNYDQDKIHKRYLNLLSDRDMITCNGQIKQRELHKAFVGYYGEKLLNRLESRIEEEDEYNWLKVLTRKPSRVVHPIRQILLMLFLCHDIDEFFKINDKNIHTFGKSPWYCLNPTASHYKQRVIYHCVVTPDYKTREPVGTFYCSCGFVYSRKGTDKTAQDAFKIGRVKKFGAAWEEKLKERLLERTWGIRELAREMKCDPKTVVKYADKLGIRSLIQGNMKYEKRRYTREQEENERRQKYRKQYEEDILNFIEQHPDYSREKIRQNLKKQYAWFYRNDYEWWDNNLPPKTPISTRIMGKHYTVDWTKRDSEYAEKIKEIYNKLIHAEKPIRITLSIVGLHLGKKDTLERCLEKLPKTKAYLTDIIESIEEFQIRRIYAACKELYNQKGIVKKWEVIRKAGLRTEYAKKLNEQIDKIIEKYSEKEVLYGREKKDT